MVGDPADDVARLGDVVAAQDAARFVGRAGDLARVNEMMDGSSSARVLYVHGPAGVGKSALLRAIERQAERLGRTVVHIDARVVVPVPDALGAAVGEGAADGDAVVVVDEVDELEPVRFELRDLVVQLPSSTVVVLAGRRAPGREWFDAGLEAVAVELALRPLDPASGRELLARYGVTDEDEVLRLLAWSGGYPLALTVAASSQTLEPGGIELSEAASAERSLAERLLARLAGRELDGVDPDALDVASIAPMVDGRLLADVLPGRATRSMLTQLRQLSLAEPVGQSIALHRLVRSAVKERLRATDPEQYRSLVLAVADHLRKRSHDDPRMMYQLADLLEAPAARVGFGASATHFADRLRPGDAERLGAALDAVGTEWWERLLRWFDELPERILVVREVSGDLAAVGVACGLDQMPAWAAEPIETGPVLRHARAAGSTDRMVALHDLHVLVDPSDVLATAEIVRVGNLGVSFLTGVPNPVRAYVTRMMRRSDDGGEPFGYGEVAELAREDHERALITVMADFGPGGVLDAIHGMIRAEQGAPVLDIAVTSAAADLLDALRAFRDDEAMARSPFAGAAGSATAARAHVRDVVGSTFGDSQTDRLLRLAVERTYLDPDGGPAVGRAELHMSRSSFYRHLQRARERLVQTLG